MLKQNKQGTWIRMDKEYTNSYLIVFSPGKALKAKGATAEIEQPKQTIAVEGDWRVKLLPTLDNKWGDYRLPASDEMIGAEARVFDYKAREWTEWRKDGIYGYGPQAVLNYGKRQSEVYDFSWEYGVWDNPGSQGYHGLKSKICDGFFILDKGGKQTFTTYVYAPTDGDYRIEQIYTPANKILLDDKQVAAEVQLAKGWHSLVVEYENTVELKADVRIGVMRDFRGRGAVVLLPKDAPAPVKPSIYDDRVAMLWTSSDHLMYDPYKGEHKVWDYRFESVPGMEQMEFAVYGKVTEVSVADKSVAVEPIGAESEQGVNRYKVTLPKRATHCEQVVFSIAAQNGRQGTAAIAEPVKITTGEGLLAAGDWSQAGVLKYYSGGMIYRKSITLPEGAAKRVMLDLGSVVATCEVKINGKAAGVMMSPPYSVDITQYLHAGENEVEVLVYSTLANHYQTQPTPYRGEPTAGILGPVSVKLY